MPFSLSTQHQYPFAATVLAVPTTLLVSPPLFDDLVLLMGVPLLLLCRSLAAMGLEPELHQQSGLRALRSPGRVDVGRTVQTTLR